MKDTKSRLPNDWKVPGVCIETRLPDSVDPSTGPAGGGAGPTPPGDAPEINAVDVDIVTAGDTVVLSGAFFDTVTSVKFGGLEAESFNIDSDNQITAVVADGSVTGDVTATSPDGTGAGPTVTVLEFGATSMASFGVVVIGPTVNSRVQMEFLPLESGTGPCRLRISNEASAFPAVSHGPEITPVDIAVYTDDGTGNPGTLIVKWLNQTIPAGAGGPWIAPATFDKAVARGTTGRALVLIGVPAATQMCATLYVANGKYADNTTIVDPAPLAWSGPNTASALTISATYPTAKRPIACLGNSIVGAYNGSNGTPTLDQSGFMKIAFDNDWPVENRSVPGSTLTGQWASDVGRPFYKARLRKEGLLVVLEPLINDLPLMANLAAYQALLAATLAELGPDIFGVVLCTGLPSSTYAVYDALRQTVNAWIRTQAGVGQILDVYDMAADFETLGDPSTPNAALYLADLTHPNVAGHVVIGVGLTAVLAPLL